MATQIWWFTCVTWIHAMVLCCSVNMQEPASQARFIHADPMSSSMDLSSSMPAVSPYDGVTCEPLENVNKIVYNRLPKAGSSSMVQCQ